MNKKERMYQEIQRHGENLNNIFNTGLEPIELCKKLLKLERQAHTLAEKSCNGDIEDPQTGVEVNKILLKVDKILHYREKNIPVKLNGDPRGFALKIDDKYMRENKITLYSDWGGYGILAPDFRD